MLNCLQIYHGHIPWQFSISSIIISIPAISKHHVELPPDLSGGKRGKRFG
jgi:hypothetical protein